MGDGGTGNGGTGNRGTENGGTANGETANGETENGERREWWGEGGGKKWETGGTGEVCPIL